MIAVALALVTIVVIWSEMTFFNKKPVLSIFALLLTEARHNYNYLLIEVSCFFLFLIREIFFAFDIKSTTDFVLRLFYKMCLFIFLLWIFKFCGCLIIAYLSFCAYYAIFKMRVFNYYYLAPNHQTNEYSLIFSGT